MTTDILDYRSAFAAGPQVCGAKAWTIARLDRWCFPVPPGLVVPAADDGAVRAADRVAPLIAAAGTLGAADLTRPEVVQRLTELRDSILAEPFGGLAELTRALEDAGLTDAAVAVRSSATGEDGSQHSFAGIHESVLNVRGPEAVARAIRVCQASLWTPQALAYRRRFAIADSDCLAAVLICRMVTAPGSDEPVAAGVVFTADPGDGRRDRIVIEAVPGLGDKLVSGRATPQRHSFAVDHWDVIDLGAPPAPALPAAQARRLARLAQRLLWALGDGEVAQDIEWAYDGAALTILQARPVTVLPRRGFAGLAGQPVMWSNANLKEVLDPVPTMLSWSIMKGGISRILFDAQLAAGMTVPEGMPLLRRFAGRPYFDISALQWAAWDCFGLPPAQYNRLLGGSQPEIALPADPAQARRDGRRRAGYRLRLVRALWGLQRRLRPWSESIQGRSRAVRRTGLSGLSAAELVALTKAWQVELLSYPIQLANCAAGAWLDMAHQIATPRLGAEAAHALVSGLMAGLGAVTSAEHGYRLQALARRKGSPTFTAELQEFLDRYGHRGFGECELANRRWDEDPAALTALLDALATTSRDRAAAEGVRREAEGGLGSLGPLAQRLVRWAAGKAQAGYALREEAKSTLVAVLGVLRAFALETGRRMVAAGVLDTAEAVFDLSAVDLQVWLDGDWDGRGAAILAADHRARRREWLALPPPADVLMEQGGGGPEPAPAVAAGSTRPGEWQGLAASPGRVEAPACILADPTEAARLSPGGILVARATDPGWTPLFLVAGGVVAETGGYLSHSAIVAREFGLPAVVNLPGILSAVTHGETLVVDGDRGRVEGRVS